MANFDNPHGLEPIGEAVGTWYLKTTTDDGIIVVNDPVSVKSDGFVKRAAEGGVWRGGVLALRSSTGEPVNHLDSTTAGQVCVCDNPHQRYRIQDNAGGTCNQAVVGTNADFKITNGDTTLGKSAVEIDGTTYADTSAQCRVIEFYDGVIGDTVNAVGNHAELIVEINESDLKSTTGI